MLIATIMFVLFSTFLLAQGFHTKAQVKRLREQLDVLNRREMDAEARLNSPKPESSKQLPLSAP